MPVLATPALGASNPTCDAQSVLAPQTTQVFGCPTPAKRKTISAAQGQTLTVSWQFTDQDGRPVDLTGCGDFDPDDPATGSVKIRAREAILIPGDTAPSIEADGEVSDLENGNASFVLPEDATSQAGVYLAEAAVFNGDGGLLFSNQFYLVINRGLFGGDQDQVCGMPSIAEIRLALRDTDPAGNPLLETVQFDLAEIAAAIEYPILYWNEAPPPINNNYTTRTFPHRFHWMRAIAAQLYRTAAHWYRRNQLTVQTQGGLVADDLNKSKEYQAIGDQIWAEYAAWVQQKKVQLNMLGAVQSSGARYY